MHEEEMGKCHREKDRGRAHISSIIREGQRQQKQQTYFVIFVAASMNSTGFPNFCHEQFFSALFKQKCEF